MEGFDLSATLVWCLTFLGNNWFLKLKPNFSICRVWSRSFINMSYLKTLIDSAFFKCLENLVAWRGSEQWSANHMIRMWFAANIFLCEYFYSQRITCFANHANPAFAWFAKMRIMRIIWFAWFAKTRIMRIIWFAMIRIFAN